MIFKRNLAKGQVKIDPRFHSASFEVNFCVNRVRSPCVAALCRAPRMSWVSAVRRFYRAPGAMAIFLLQRRSGRDPPRAAPRPAQCEMIVFHLLRGRGSRRCSLRFSFWSHAQKTHLSWCHCPPVTCLQTTAVLLSFPCCKNSRLVSFWQLV